MAIRVYVFDDKEEYQKALDVFQTMKKELFLFNVNWTEKKTNEGKIKVYLKGEVTPELFGAFEEIMEEEGVKYKEGGMIGMLKDVLKRFSR
ncbi:MAG: hypothetical protein Fur0024_4520 [Patescibacteria group bacterium]